MFKLIKKSENIIRRMPSKSNYERIQRSNLKLPLTNKQSIDAFIRLFNGYSTDDRDFFHLLVQFDCLIKIMNNISQLGISNLQFKKGSSLFQVANLKLSRSEI